MTGAPTPWSDAALAATLLAVDPAGLKGVSVRARAGPVRDAWLDLIKKLLPKRAPLRRLPAHIGDDRLLGGLDLSATLRTGRPVAERGLLAEVDGGVLVVAMAERLPAGLAARIASVLDSGIVTVERDGLTLENPSRFAVVALDEGAESDEHPPAALLDRLSFQLDLGTVGLRDVRPGSHKTKDVAAARRLLPEVAADDAAIAAVCEAAGMLGVHSMRGPLLTIRAACAAAALAGRKTPDETDLAAAARLVLAPRATRLPAPPDEAEPPPEEPDPPPDDETADNEDEQELHDRPLEDQVLEAATAALPPDLLAQLKLGNRRARSPSAGKEGDQGEGGGRGRPAGTRRGEPRAGERLNVVETLRAAAPWQPLRRAEGGPAGGPRVRVRQDDFRTTRIKRRTGTTTIFVVDASGSSALHRLAEAKGAVEMLLADCYIRRDEVALIAFRGTGAELLLPPTRSLVRARRGLAGLPGGGGTPLAAGLDAAAALATAVRRKGRTPAIVMITDGRANVARDGTGGRAQAAEEALASARALRSEGFTSLLVDSAPRPQQRAEELAREMGALYLPLPRADAATLSGAVQASLGGSRAA